MRRPAAALQTLGGAKVMLGIVTSNAAMTDTLGGLTHHRELIVIGVTPSHSRSARSH